MVEYVDALLMMAHFMLCCVLVSLSFHIHLESSILFLIFMVKGELLACVACLKIVSVRLM